jgi:hypothetical protein
MCNNLKPGVPPGLTLDFLHLLYTMFGFFVVRKQQMSPSAAFTNSISSESKLCPLYGTNWIFIVKLFHLFQLKVSK